LFDRDGLYAPTIREPLAGEPGTGAPASYNLVLFSCAVHAADPLTSLDSATDANFR
jgi:hypothetical protein